MAVSSSSFSIRKTDCFLSAKRDRQITLTPIKNSELKKFLEKQDKETKNLIDDLSFSAKPGEVLFLNNKTGKVSTILFGIDDTAGLYDISPAIQKITAAFDKKALGKISFNLIKGTLKDNELVNLCAGWGLTCYRFDAYKGKEKSWPKLLLPTGVDKKHVLSVAESIILIRDLINTPANHMGPDDLEKAARALAKAHEATVKVTGDKVLQKDFPLVFAVGDSSPRRPRLIDINWGNAKHPKVTLVGKGVCFDTGGLDLKPSQYMALMKKDMGGAAHVLGLARMIMGMKLPVRLRVLIPAVENSVSGVAFRPGDVFTSRKGITVENTNTDAEGRLILADTLTYACEDKPELVIDFATLTGSARAALGQEIPAMFSNNDKIAEGLKKASFAADDPVWPMPLYQPYKKLIESDIADLVNSAKTPGDLIYSALFLESFLDGKTDWIHLDCFAWQSSSKPGKPAGGTDTGMRAVYAYLENRYGKKK